MRQALGYSDQHVVVGKIARLFPLKGHEYVIAAARQVVAQNPLVRFLLVGSGVLAGSLRESVSRAGMDTFTAAQGDKVTVPIKVDRQWPEFKAPVQVVVANPPTGIAGGPSTPTVRRESGW